MSLHLRRRPTFECSQLSTRPKSYMIYRCPYHSSAELAASDLANIVYSSLDDRPVTHQVQMSPSIGVCLLPRTKDSPRVTIRRELVLASMVLKLLSFFTSGGYVGLRVIQLGVTRSSCLPGFIRLNNCRISEDGTSGNSPVNSRFALSMVSC